jgi:nitrogen fixation NifU-like protein
MINEEIIKLASFTNNVGLKNKFTHKSSIKNSLCGDLIKTEFIANKYKIKSMRYETESCILCEASASLLARKIKDFDIRALKKEVIKLEEIKKNSNYKFPKRLNEFNKLISKKTINRLDCVILPMKAFLKAFRINS